MGTQRYENPKATRQGPERSVRPDPATSDPDSAARQGVRMGYDVMDRHTQEGRDEAWRRTGAPPTAPAAGWPPGYGDPMGLGPGMPTLGSLLGPWMWLLQAPARMFQGGFGGRGHPPPHGGYAPFTAGPSRPPPGPPGAPEPPPTPGAQPWAHGWSPTSPTSPTPEPATPEPAPTEVSARAPTVSIGVTSMRPTQVDVALPALDPDTALKVMPLHPVDGAQPPLPEVRVHAERERVSVAVIVPDDHPPGRYAGAVLRREDGVVLGAIGVVVSDP